MGQSHNSFPFPYQEGLQAGHPRGSTAQVFLLKEFKASKMRSMGKEGCGTSYVGLQFLVLSATEKDGNGHCTAPVHLFNCKVCEGPRHTDEVWGKQGSQMDAQRELCATVLPREASLWLPIFWGLEAQELKLIQKNLLGAF